MPGAFDTRAVGTNNQGIVIGFYEDAFNEIHGFLPTEGNFITIDVPSALATQVFGINAPSEIVGRYTDSTGHAHGFVATPNH